MSCPATDLPPSSQQDPFRGHPSWSWCSDLLAGTRHRVSISSSASCLSLSPPSRTWPCLPGRIAGRWHALRTDGTAYRLPCSLGRLYAGNQRQQLIPLDHLFFQEPLRKLIEQLARRLLEKEVVEGDELHALLAGATRP